MSGWELPLCNNCRLLFKSQCPVQLFATPWIAALQTLPSFTISQSLFKLMSIELVMLSNHLILCLSLLLLPSIFPSTRVFSNESTLCIKWPKDWSFGFSISPSNEYSGLISLGLTGLISFLSKGLSGFPWNRAVCPLVLLDMIYSKKEILHHNTQIKKKKSFVK